MTVRKSFAWILAVLATVYLVVAVYARTVIGIGIKLPFIRDLPQAPFESLFNVERLTAIAVSVFLALVLLLAVWELRRQPMVLRIPRWGLPIAAILILAVAIELAALIWQNFIFDARCPRCTIDERVDKLNIFDGVEYVGIIANRITYWALIVVISLAIGTSKPLDRETRAAGESSLPT